MPNKYFAVTTRSWIDCEGWFVFVLMVWQRFPDAAELNILTIKPTSTQFGPRPIFQDLLSSKDFLSMWNWEFYRKGLFSWFIVIFFLLLRVDSSGDFDFPQLENSLQVNPFPPHPASFLFFIINVMLFPHFAGNHIPIPLSPTMNDICSKSLRSLRCRLEMGKTSTNSNSTTGLIKKRPSSFIPTPIR